MSGKILVVDDDRDIRETIVDALEGEGYDVISAVDGVDALERLRSEEQSPSLILLDLMMPRMNGHGALARDRTRGDLGTHPDRRRQRRRARPRARGYDGRGRVPQEADAPARAVQHRRAGCCEGMSTSLPTGRADSMSACARDLCERIGRHQRRDELALGDPAGELPQRLAPRHPVPCAARLSQREANSLVYATDQPLAHAHRLAANPRSTGPTSYFANREISGYL